MPSINVFYNKIFSITNNVIEIKIQFLLQSTVFTGP